jgi:cation-transporting ATPase E
MASSTAGTTGASAPIAAAPPVAAGGLSSAEARSLTERGLANVDSSKQRDDWDVVRANTLTFFNILLISLIVALAALGQIRDGAFVGVVIVANIVVSTFQELRATRTLRRLVALTAPTATVVRDGVEQAIAATAVVQGDLVHLEPGDQVVADGHISARRAEIDESLLTGESDSVTRSEGDELKSGSFCVGGDCYYRAEKVGAAAYMVRLTADAKELVRRRTPLQVRFNRILRVLLTVTGVLAAFLVIQYMNEDGKTLTDAIRDVTALVTTVVPVGLLLGITVSFAVGAVRVAQAGAIVQDISAVEALNYVDVICLDKTGTLTANELKLDTVSWATGMEGYLPWLGAYMVAARRDSKTAAALAEGLAARSNSAEETAKVPFNSERRWSALRLKAGGEERVFVLGAPESVFPGDGEAAAPLLAMYQEATGRGLRGVAFAECDVLPEVGKEFGEFRPLALITLGDVLRPEVTRAFEMMDELGIEPKIISGDNPHTVAALLAQLGIHPRGGLASGDQLAAMSPEQFGDAVEATTVFGRIDPDQKAAIVSELRKQGHFVAMVGDGANDVRALRAADVAVAMASGTSTARAVAGIVLLKDSFEALIRGVKEATGVLGNAARLTKLFLAKSIYAFLLIVATNMLGLDFPFLPRQGSITALLSLGIPAVFISISVPPPGSGRDFTNNVLRFALPASGALAAAAIAVYLLTESLPGRGVEEARTLSSLTLGITGLFFMVEILGFEGASWRSLTRPVLTTFLGAILIGGFIVTMYTPGLRDFFAFTKVGWSDWVIVGVAVAASLGGQYGLSRYWQQILNILTAAPRKADELRGRAT